MNHIGTYKNIGPRIKNSEEVTHLLKRHSEFSEREIKKLPHLELGTEKKHASHSFVK